MQRLTFPFPFVHHQSHDWPLLRVGGFFHVGSSMITAQPTYKRILSQRWKNEIEETLLREDVPGFLHDLRLRDQTSDSEEVVTPLMLDGTYLSRNFATLGPLT